MRSSEGIQCGDSGEYVEIALHSLLKFVNGEIYRTTGRRVGASRNRGLVVGIDVGIGMGYRWFLPIKKVACKHGTHVIVTAWWLCSV